LATVTSDALNQENKPILSNKHTNWDDFRRLVNERLTLNIPFRTEEAIEAAVMIFNYTIQWAGWNGTPEHKRALKAYNCPIITKQKIEEKEDSVENDTDHEQQQARDYVMQQHRNSKNSSITTKMTASKHSCKGHTQTESTDFSLWKATKKLKHVKKRICHCEYQKEFG
jgi:hypothetical protein